MNHEHRRELQCLERLHDMHARTGAEYTAAGVRDAIETLLGVWTEDWHSTRYPIMETKLHAHLGLTDSEYARWVENPTCLPVVDLREHVPPR